MDSLIEALRPGASDAELAAATAAVEGLDPSGRLGAFAGRLRRRERGIRAWAAQDPEEEVRGEAARAVVWLLKAPAE